MKAAEAYVQPSLLSLRFKADWDQVTQLTNVEQHPPLSAVADTVISCYSYHSS
jgi:hypothetical protein